MIGRLVRQLTHHGRRVPAVRGAIEKVFPEHWSFLLGELALYSFVVLVVTGVYLVLFFNPSSEPTVYQGSHAPLRGVEMSRAYASVLDLSFDVRAGLLARQIHHWAALVFVAAVVGHLVRVLVTGAFRRPRELNWMVGASLLFLGMAAGYTGYSMLDDVLSRTGLQVGQAILMSVPVVGAWLALLFFGGELPGPDVVARLYWAHVLVLPVLIAGLIGLHMLVLLLQKHTQFPGPERTEDNVVGTRLWPRYTFETLGLFFALAALLAALGGLAQINPVWLYGPYSPGAATPGSQPDWYWAWMEGGLRLMPGWELRAFGYTVPNPFFPAVLLPALTFALLYVWPFLEARLVGDREPHHVLDRPRDHPLRTAIAVGVVTFYAVLGIGGSNDILALYTGVPLTTIVWTLRVLLLVLPPLAALAAYLLARRLAESEAPGILHVPLRRRARADRRRAAS